MTTKFNMQNKGHENGYPLFMGEDLGIIDTINVSYPILEMLYLQQVSQIWNEFEVDLTQDRMDMLELPKDTVDLMVKTIMWQTVADSTAARSIIESLGDYITNPELLNLATLWSFFEIIHARTYSHIIKQTFQYPREMLDDLYNEMGVMQRAEVIIKVFDEMAELPKDASDKEKRKAIIKVLVALFALEGVAFMSSFAVTFGITETGVFQGIGKLVELICRDEVTHARNSYETLNIVKQDSEWNLEMIMMSQEIKDILDSVVSQEMKWCEYLFSDGRSVIGLNEALLKEYVLFMAYPIYKFFGIDFDFEVITENPLPYMDNYVDTSKIQTAKQEIQDGAYQVGAIVDDTADMDLDMDMDF